MITRYKGAAALAALLLPVSVCAAPPSPTATAPLKMLVMDPLAAKNACICVVGLAQREYPALASYLALPLGRKIALSYHKELTAAIADPAKPDLVVAKYSEGLAYAARTGQKLTPIASLTGKDGTTTQRGIIVVRGDDAAKGLADLAGKRVALGPPSSEEKNSAAIEALAAAGAAPTGQPIIAPTCNEACLMVIDGKADVAAISSYALPLAVGCGTIPRTALRVVGKTKPVPFITLFAKSTLDPALVAKLAKALASVASSQDLIRLLETERGFLPFRLAGAARSADPGVLPKTTTTRSEPGWTDWRGGPKRDGLVASLPDRLPEHPTVVWRTKLDSPGMGGVTATGSVVIVSDKSPDQSTDIWRCLSAQDGHQLWDLRDPGNQKMEYGSGPRANAVIVGDRVVLLSALGLLQAADLATGKRLWQVDLPRRYSTQAPTWGFAGTPVVEGGRVIVPTGSPALGLAAFSLADGKESWTARAGAPGYGSFIAASLGGKRQVVGHDATTLGGWDPVTGRRLWSLKPPQTHDFNVPTPLPALGGLVVATENNGTRLYTFAAGGAIKPAPVRRSMDLRPVTCTPVLVDGMLWGCADAGLFCLDAATFKTVWHSEDGSFLDHVNLVGAPGRVLACTKDGRLALLPSRPTASTRPQFVTVVRPASPTDDVAVWSHPAIVGSRLYLRTQAEAICLDLGAR